MRRYLINLTRLGDLLQTQPVLHALKARGDDIGLICLENFADAAALLHGPDYVAALPGSAMLAALARDWRLCAGGLQSWLREQHEMFPAEHVLNLTPTLSARLLARLLAQGAEDAVKNTAESAGPSGIGGSGLEGSAIGGFGLDDHGFGLDSSPWATYVQAMSANRGCSPFNLVDAFRCVAGVEHMPPVPDLRPPAPDILAAVAQELAAATCDAGLAGASGLVAFQLGASAEARRWPAPSFAKLGRILKEKANLAPVLLGSKGEAPLAAEYLAAGGPGVDFTGRTDLPRLAAAVLSCKLLVTNDTGTMHLAAGLGVPVLAIFLATAQPWDTGPYREGMCCLEPRLDCHPCGYGTACPHDGACRAAVSAEAVAGLALAWLETGHWPELRSGRAVTEVRVWLTRRDERSFMDLASMSGDEGADRTLWIRRQRRFYRRFLDRLADERGDAKNPPQESAASADAWVDAGVGTTAAALLPLSPARSEQIRQILAHADGLLLLALEQGNLLTGGRGLPRMRQAFLGTCERLSALFDASPDFVPLAHLWRAILHDSASGWPALARFFEILRQELALLATELT